MPTFAQLLLALLLASALVAEPVPSWAQGSGGEAKAVAESTRGKDAAADSKDQGQGNQGQGNQGQGNQGQERGGLPLPRFVSVRAPQVNLRTGPGVRYPIDWLYSRAGLPLEVIDEFETWRRVRDWEGSTGWVHQSMLSGERTVMVVGQQRLLRRDPDPAGPGVALLEVGVIGELRSCAGAWCQIRVGDKSGWLLRADLFGVYPDEAIR